MRGQELERALAAWAKGLGLPCQCEDDNADEVAPPPSPGGKGESRLTGGQGAGGCAAGPQISKLMKGHDLNAHLLMGLTA